MAKCSHCGQEVSLWSRDLFTGACPKCVAGGVRPASLGCGTLILIALIVLIFSRTGIGQLETEVSRLQMSVEELKKASEVQTTAIRDLRLVVEEQRKGAGEKNK